MKKVFASLKNIVNQQKKMMVVIILPVMMFHYIVKNVMKEFMSQKFAFNVNFLRMNPMILFMNVRKDVNPDLGLTLTNLSVQSVLRKN